MVRITSEEKDNRIELRIEGSLRGPWVPELEQVWRDSRGRSKHLHVNLDDVSFVDDAGKTLLTRMFQDGTELSADGLYMTDVVEEIICSARHAVTPNGVTAK